MLSRRLRGYRSFPKKEPLEKLTKSDASGQIRAVKIINRENFKKVGNQEIKMR